MLIPTFRPILTPGMACIRLGRHYSGGRPGGEHFIAVQHFTR